jgi:glycosyltransferase involved in cell wall biosynthesis
MKILTAMYTMRRGGAYDRFVMMMEALLDRGCQVHCLSLTPISIPHEGYKNHLVLKQLGKTRFAKGIVLFVFPLYGVWVGHREKIDLFVAFGALYAFIEGVPKWVLRKPMVTFLRGSFAFGMRAQGQHKLLLWLSQWIERVGIRISDTILSVNSAIQEEMRIAAGGRRGQRWEVLPNNIPFIPVADRGDISQTRRNYGIPEGAKILITAGVITCGKNLELLIQCLPQIGMENLVLLIAGDAATEADSRYRIRLKELVDNQAVRDRVVFTGWIEKQELWRLFFAADLFVLPSVSEGMPNVMLEALGCGLPCMGSDIPGITDVLQYRVLMFNPKDPGALSNKIQRYLSVQGYADGIKKLCGERRKAFSFDWKERTYQIVTGIGGGLLREFVRQG